MKYTLRSVLLILLCAFFLLPIRAQENSDPLGVLNDSRFQWSDLDSFRSLGLEGAQIRVFGALVDEDAERLMNALRYFEAASGIDVEYSGSGDFASLLMLEISKDLPPDVLILDHPAQLSDLAQQGLLVPLPDSARQSILENVAGGESWVKLGSVDEAFYALGHNVNLKSLIWYAVESFDQAGYAIPQTWDELLALSDEMSTAGVAPWCMALESSAATGWPAADFIENLMLRTVSAEDFAAWIGNDLPFTDASVRNAFDLFGQIGRNEAYLFGGTANLLTTNYGDGPDPLFSTPPGCYLHFQDSQIPLLFPEEIDPQTESGVFYFPPLDPALGRPVMGTTHLIAQSFDRPEAAALMQYLMTPLAQELLMIQGGYITPLKTADVAIYPSPLMRQQGEILLSADRFQYDASDLMPEIVGGGVFWTAAADYVAGVSAEEVTEFVQAAWDRADAP